MAGTYVIQKHNGEVFNANFTFRQEEIERLLDNSKTTETFVIANLITRQIHTLNGRKPV